VQPVRGRDPHGRTLLRCSPAIEAILTDPPLLRPVLQERFGQDERGPHRDGIDVGSGPDATRLAWVRIAKELDVLDVDGLAIDEKR